MSRSAHEIDKKQQQEFMNYSQSTHKAVVSNSVGMALMTLYNNYFGVRKIEDKPVIDEKHYHIVQDTKVDATKKDIIELEKEYQECIGQLNAMCYDSKNQTSNLEKKAAVDYILERTKDPLSILDIVHLSFLKDKDSKELFDAKNFTEEQHIFGLKLVLVLIWKAINDDARFIQNYPGTNEEKLRATKADRMERISSFFNCLINIKNEAVCHHGNRNELVFNLNKTYEGLDLIEIESSTVKAIFNDEINKLFWAKYQDNKITPQEKRVLLNHLYEWMHGEEGAALKLVEYLDPNNKIIDQVKKLFVDNGSNPNKISLDKTIKEALDSLYFTCDPTKDKALDRVNKIFNFVDDKKQSQRNTALAKMQRWIREEYDLENPKDNEKINAFYDLFTTHTMINEAMPILTATGLMREEYNQLLKAYNDIFLAINRPKDIKDFKDSKQTDTNIPSLSAELVNIRDNLLVDYKKAKTDGFVDKIENFFVNFASSKQELAQNNASQYKVLSNMLFSEIFKNKVILKDDDIKNIFKESKDEKGTIELTPYIINRVFLHAILTPEAWSEEFSKEFKRVLAFVKSGFNQSNGAANFNAASLSQHSYSRELIGQLEYLGNKYSPENRDEKVGSVPRPNELFILTPGECKDHNDWFQFLYYLDDSIKEKIYGIRAAQINEIFFLYWSHYYNDYVDYENTYFHLLRAIPKAHRYGLLKKINEKNSNMFNYPKIDILLDIMKLLPEEHRLHYLNLFTDIQLISIYHNLYRNYASCDKLKATVELLPLNEKIVFLNKIIDLFLAEDVHLRNINQLTPILQHFDRTSCLKLVKKIASQPPSISGNLSTLLEILDRNSSYNDCKEAEQDKLNLLNDFFTLHKMKSIKDFQELRNILQYFNNENKIKILPKLDNYDLRSLSGKLIEDINDNKNGKSYLDLLLAFNTWDKNLIHLEEIGFSLIKQKLIEDVAISTFLNSITPKVLISLIKTAKDLREILPYIRKQNQYHIIDTSMEKFKDILQCSKSLKNMLLLMNTRSSIERYALFSKLVTAIKTPDDLILLLNAIKEINNRKETVSTIDEKLPITYNTTPLKEAIKDTKNNLDEDKKLDTKHVEVSNTNGIPAAAAYTTYEHAYQLTKPALATSSTKTEDNKQAIADSYIEFFINSFSQYSQTSNKFFSDWNSLLHVLELLNDEQKISLIKKIPEEHLKSLDTLTWDKSLSDQANMDRVLLLQNIELFNNYISIDPNFLYPKNLSRTKPSFDFITSLKPSILKQLIPTLNIFLEILKLIPDEIKDEKYFSFSKGQEKPVIRFIANLPKECFDSLCKIDNLTALLNLHDISYDVRKAIYNKLSDLKVSEDLLFDASIMRPLPSDRISVEHDPEYKDSKQRFPKQDNKHDSKHPVDQDYTHTQEKGKHYSYLVIYYNIRVHTYNRLNTRSTISAKDILELANDQKYTTANFLTLEAAEYFIKNIPYQAKILKIDQPYLKTADKITFFEKISPLSVQWHKLHESISKNIIVNDKYENTFSKIEEDTDKAINLIKNLETKRDNIINSQKLLKIHSKFPKISNDSDDKNAANLSTTLKANHIPIEFGIKFLQGTIPDIKSLNEDLKKVDLEISSVKKRLQTYQKDNKPLIDKINRAKILNSTAFPDSINQLQILVNKHSEYLMSRAAEKFKEKFNDDPRPFANNLVTNRHNFLLAKYTEDNQLSNRIASHFLTSEVGRILNDKSKPAYFLINQLSEMLNTPINKLYPVTPYYLSTIEVTLADYLKTSGSLSFGISQPPEKAFVANIDNIFKHLDGIFKKAGLERVEKPIEDAKPHPVKK